VSSRRAPLLLLAALAAVAVSACRRASTPSPSAPAPSRPPPLGHSRDEIDRRQAQLAAEAERLPPSLRALITPRLRIVATVSVTEGSFDGVATRAGDRAASLGIFQWAMARKRTRDDGSSLWRLFHDLARRAARCRDNDDECRLYHQAWRQCRAAGLTIRNKILRLHKKPANGGAVERALQPAMATGALRTYQLLAANDWIERIAAQPVHLTPTELTTVGQLLRSDRALATAVLVGVNRPAYLVPALERALVDVPRDDDAALVAALRREALALYTPAERERRELRLRTSDTAFSPP
jgi:hypothetical protein